MSNYSSSTTPEPGPDAFITLPFVDYTNISLGETVFTFCLFCFLVALAVYTMFQLRHIAEHLLLRFRVLTWVSVISHLAAALSIFLAMIFYQMMPYHSLWSTLSVCSAMFWWAFAKTSMYFLFLDRLYTTFNSSAYSLNRSLVIVVSVFICINCAIYASITYWWFSYRKSGDLMVWYLGVITFPIEIFYSVVIVAQFATKLYHVNLGRTNETKANKYARRVRAETSEHLEQDFKAYQRKMMSATSERALEHRPRSGSDVNRKVAGGGGGANASNMGGKLHLQIQTQSNNFSERSDLPSQSSQPAMERRASTVQNLFHRQGSQKPPTLRSRKSFFDTHFVDHNRDILDDHQVKFISTISRYTVLAFIAFFTSLLGGVVALMRIFQGESATAFDIDSRMRSLVALFLDCTINLSCVLLNFGFNRKLYGVLCCCFKRCFQRFFLYLSIRSVMIEVEKKVEEKIIHEIEVQSLEEHPLPIHEEDGDYINHSDGGISPMHNSAHRAITERETALVINTVGSGSASESGADSGTGGAVSAGSLTSITVTSPSQAKVVLLSKPKNMGHRDEHESGTEVPQQSPSGSQNFQVIYARDGHQNNNNDNGNDNGNDKNVNNNHINTDNANESHTSYVALRANDNNSNSAHNNSDLSNNHARKDRIPSQSQQEHEAEYPADDPGNEVPKMKDIDRSASTPL